MNEAETLTLFYQTLEVAHAVFANWMAIVFAMLVASYLFARKLSRKMSALVITAYSLFGLGYGFELINIYADLADMSGEVARMSRLDGSSIGWHSFARAGIDKPLGHIVPFMSVMVVFVYCCTIVFFFLARQNVFTDKMELASKK